MKCERALYWRRPSFAVAAVASLLLVALMAYSRVVIYPHRLVPLTYAVFLLAALWHRDRRLLWAMTTCFLLLSAYKVLWLVPNDYFDDGLQQFVFAAMQWLNILVPAVALHAVLVFRERLERVNADLSLTNAELEAGNEELAAREEEIARQNEELQSQAEELEQQTEELRAQTEELQALNEELAGREQTLQMLLQLAGPETSETEVLERICAAAPTLLGENVSAVAALERRDGRMVLHAHSNLGRDDAGAEVSLPAERTLAALAMDHQQLAELEDTHLRPDLCFVPTPDATPPRSVLAAPLALNRQSAGVLEAYSTRARPWSARQAQLLQWLAAQCSRAWENARLQEELQRHQETLVEANRQIRENEAQFRMVANSIPQLAWMARPDGHIFWYNERWHAYTGMSPEQMEGWGWQAVHDPAEIPRVVRRWKDALAAAQPWEDTFPLRRHDGAMRWHLSRAMPLYDEQGRVVRWFGTNTDITERLELEASLERARQTAEDANVAKSQFLANMSHELRTPMNAILGMTDLALSEELAPTVRDYLDTARESAATLLELLNQILDFSRIEAGRFELDSTPFSPRETVEQVVKSLGVRAYEKGLELICDMETDLPEHFIGDPLRLRQILVNLIGNAIKFTSKGEVVVRVERMGQGSSVAEGGGEGDARPKESDSEDRIAAFPASSITLHFSVADTGIGIAAEEQPRLFAPFTQADASTTRHYGGSGLGLAICRSLVELMQGRIWVESRVGAGSTFHFTVRLAPHDLGADPEIPPLTREALQGVPVLVVVENPTLRHILERTLARWALAPLTAADVPAALAMLHQAANAGRHFRLVLADALIPGIDGFTLAEWLRAEPKLAGPVVLMLSANERRDLGKRCEDVGVLCLDKPVSQSKLVNMVTMALGIERQAAKLPCGQRPRPSTAPARALRVLLAEDTRANQKLVSYILGKRGHVVETAGNGRQALELAERHEFDVVLMDVQMPVMDGFQATAALRKLEDERKARVPIIAMTAHALKGDAERCLAAGMDAYLSKPIEGEELIHLIERLAPRGKERDSDDRKNGHREDALQVGSKEKAVGQDVGRATADPLVFDFDEAVRRCYGKYPMFQEMVECFFQESAPALGAMRAALNQGNSDELGYLAHRLKGTLCYLGAPAALEAARRLEGMGRNGQLGEALEAIDDLGRRLGPLRQMLTEHRKTDAAT